MSIKLFEMLHFKAFNDLKKMAKKCTQTPLDEIVRFVVHLYVRVLRIWANAKRVHSSRWKWTKRRERIFGLGLSSTVFIMRTLRASFASDRISNHVIRSDLVSWNHFFPLYTHQFSIFAVHLPSTQTFCQNLSLRKRKKKETAKDGEPSIHT